MQHTLIFARLEEKVAGLSARVRELEGNLRSLRQADADGGVQMEKVIAEVQFLRGELEEARFQIGDKHVDKPRAGATWLQTRENNHSTFLRKC